VSADPVLREGTINAERGNRVVVTFRGRARKHAA
jgi:hypothetical protein